LLDIDKVLNSRDMADIQITAGKEAA